MQYKIVTEYTPSKATKAVQKLLDDGWTLYGPLHFEMGTYVQPLVKYTDEVPKPVEAQHLGFHPKGKK